MKAGVPIFRLLKSLRLPELQTLKQPRQLHSGIEGFVPSIF